MSSRYLIGIDLGTTNSVVAYLDTRDNADASSVIRVFPVPQLVRPGEIGSLPVLPSFLYFPTDEELSAGGVSANWNEHPAMVTGVLAREQGALVPSRQVSSAKSWLSYPGVHRRGKILPAQAESPQPMISLSKHPRATSCTCAMVGTAQWGVTKKRVLNDRKSCSPCQVRLMRKRAS